MTSALTALLLLAAEPAVEQSEPRPTVERRHAVFAQPLATVLGAAVLHGISVSGGVLIRANEEWSFVGDFAVLLWGSGGQGEDLRGATSAAISLGWSARVKGEGLSGLFLTPKIYGVAGDHTGPTRAPHRSSAPTATRGGRRVRSGWGSTSRSSG